MTTNGLNRHPRQAFALTARELTVDFKAPAFSTPVPIEGTLRSNDYHRQAVEQANTCRLRHGSGSAVLIAAREWPATYRGWRLPG